MRGAGGGVGGAGTNMRSEARQAAERAGCWPLLLLLLLLLPRPAARSVVRDARWVTAPSIVLVRTVVVHVYVRYVQLYTVRHEVN
eukprot:COSAG01_NODE_1748_length_9329_cov_99.035861_9_plen_85_part_00